MENKKENILIVGSGASANALIKKLSQNSKVGKIYVTSSDNIIYENTNKIDIREDDLNGLLIFVVENGIDITIPISEKALKADIVPFFQSNGQNIFGPSKDACNIFLNNIQCKKFLYKIQAKTPKFGIYNKLQQAMDYLKNSNFPVLIKTAENSPLHNDKMICTTLNNAQDYIESLFMKGEADILIEDYTYGHNFTVYYITDGYCALPLGIVGNYKFIEDGNNGQYFDGVGCYCPDYKISNSVIEKVSSIANRLLSELESHSNPYLGIFGIECVLTDENNFVVEDLKPYLQDYEASAVLGLFEDDIIEIILACINGYFADEYEEIKTNEFACASLCVYAKYKDQEITGLEEYGNIDFMNTDYRDGKYYTKQGFNFCVTKTASTLNRAKKLLYEDLDNIKFCGIKYRKDICVNIER